MDAANKTLDGDAALLVLARHQERRRQRFPTVTVIAGNSQAATKLVRRFAEIQGRPVCESSSLGEGDAIEYVVAACDPRRLTSTAYQRIADRAQCDAKFVTAAMSARSAQEQVMFLDRTLGTEGVSPIDAVSRALAEHLWQFGSIMPGLGRRLLDACKGDVSRAAAGILTLVGDDQAPLLYASCAGEAAALRALVADAASLAMAAPQVPIVVSASAHAVEAYLAVTHECRAAALVREGVLWLAEAQLATPMSIAAEAAEEVPKPSGGNHGQMPSVVDVALSATDDAARSAAERYLFERLQSHPLTTGLFALNGLLESRGRSLEVDLLAREVRVAVEIDGYYHFTDRDAYRRDREKDMLLQHAGYFVVRCLADDVASRLEEILETIIAAVRRR